ncbi:hypothetical protein [Mucilaginibacter lacusdianchii]|uniref:hypothetical protein n=1 Tax=Mucilaginibacter lacusdianchii TaxID=2684211 RepID=UPI00131E22B6|nr:hypothetical protein [Mucilaginibacter sp. JXJ CY 39]
MSLKSLSKTRWKIESDRVTIYPYGVFYVFTAVIAVLFTGLLWLYISYQNTTIVQSLPFVLFLLLMVVLFWGFASTYIEFDNRKGTMRKMLMGFIPTTTIPFGKLQGINAVSNMAGSYNYRLFQKNARYGKGIIVSSGYTKNDDPNAIAFVNEAVPMIHGYLDLHDSPTDYIEQSITSFKYFKQEGNIYTIKNNKAGALVFALFFFGLGIWLFTVPVESLITTLLMIALVFFFGLVFVNAAFTQLIFNPQARTVERKGLFKFLNKAYSLDHFAGLQTVRHSMNFIYVRTSVNLYFEVPGKNGKQDILTIGSRYRSKSVERFIQEFSQIMGL